AKEPQTVDKLRQVFMQDLSTRVLENKLEQLSKVHKQPSRSLQDIICHCRPPSAAASEPESLTKRTPTTKLPSTTEARTRTAWFKEDEDSEGSNVSVIVVKCFFSIDPISCLCRVVCASNGVCHVRYFGHIVV
ncbi:hypothetical protein INR49_017965, partial [Caranx melampygus]